MSLLKPRSVNFFTFLVVLLILLLSTEKASTFEEPPSKNSSSAQTIADALAKSIKQAANELEYPDEVGEALVKMVSDWNCVEWKQRLSQVKQDFREKKISADQVANIEQEVVQELRRKIRREINLNATADSKYYDLSNVVKDKRAQCLGCCQLFSVIGKAIGLSVKVIDVTTPAIDYQTTIKGHVACLVDLTNGKVTMVDLRLRIDSQAFNFDEAFSQIGNYLELKSKDIPLKIHQKIQIWDERGITSAIYLSRGWINHKSGQSAEAIYIYTKAIALNPKSALAYVDRGYEYASLGQYTTAIADFSKAIEVNPKYVEAYVGRGSAHGQSGHFRESISDYSKAIALNPKCVEAYIGRGSTHGRLRHYTESLSDYSRAIELDPKNPDGYVGRGTAHYHLIQFVEAISDYNQAIEIDPKNANAFCNRGYAEASLGKPEEAKKDLQKAFELNSDYKTFYP
jgi:tetratricopeptide (TPR) repeat protein